MLKSQILLAPAKDFGCATFMHVVGMDVADAGMVVLGVVPGEEAGEVVEDRLRVECGEGLRVGGRGLDGAEKRFDKGVVVGSARTGQSLGDTEVGKHLHDGLGGHLDAAVVDCHGPEGRRGVKNALGKDGIVDEQPRLGGGEGLHDAPGQHLARPFVKHDVEEPEPAADIGRDVADVPAPALVGTVKDGGTRGLDATATAVDGPAPVRQEAVIGKDGTDGGGGEGKEAQLTALDGDGLQREVHGVLPGHKRADGMVLLGHECVPGTPRPRLGIGQGARGSLARAPAFHAAHGHLQEHARMDAGKALAFRVINHRHHLGLGSFRKPGGGKRPGHSKFTFFLRAVNMTINSAKACSLSAISCRSLS